jgi:hypothetical protein
MLMGERPRFAGAGREISQASGIRKSTAQAGDRNVDPASAPVMQRNTPETELLDLTQTGRRRRPTGTPAPLPKSIGLSGRLWVAAALLIVVLGCVWLHVSAGRLDRFDAAIARPVLALRTDWLDPLARALNSVGSRWGLGVLAIAVAVLAIAYRRF